MTTQEVRVHYVSAWGQPSREAMFTFGDTVMEVFKWSHETTEEGVNLYATCGASRRQMGDTESRHRVEFATGLLPDEDRITSALALLGTFPLSGRTISYGESVTLGDPLWPDTSMQSFLTVRPMEDLLPDLQVSDHGYVQFMNVVPMFESELRLRNGRSAEWLMGELNDHDVSWWDPRRKPLAY
ncbi:suppressor of fused domain protein [Streptomyces violascens]|uniref:Suppressor of fused-like domain-containing protein n=1 Tax=Streptomyces violascens TaxID=67381 RepID=A0ABQ3QRR5_9ACTN|nr:suppressor of fused domain protein [Streptomyces violascens]GHI39965.1 hypothetical protein Sviol_43730 [Streptomyces violascens]